MHHFSLNSVFSQLKRRHVLLALGSWVASGALLANPALASQPDTAWPERPVRIIAPFSPGAATDQVSRYLAQQMAEKVGNQFVVENRTGAAGRIAAEAVVKSAPDGYTVLFGEPGGLVVAPAVYASTNFETQRDLVPVAQVVSMPMVLVVHPSLGVSNLAELKAASQRGDLNYGTNGTGSVQHLTMDGLGRALNIPLTHVPYRGGANALTDLIAGQIQLSLLTIPTVEAQIRAGQIVPIAVLNSERSPLLPETPTVAEQGISGFEVPIWCGFFMPANTPAPIVEKMSVALGEVLANPETQERLKTMGNQVTYRNHHDFQQWVNQDIDRWQGIVKQAGVRLD